MLSSSIQSVVRLVRFWYTEPRVPRAFAIGGAMVGAYVGGSSDGTTVMFGTVVGFVMGGFVWTTFPIVAPVLTVCSMQRAFGNLPRQRRKFD
jgi:hypothetical protein